MICIGHRGAMGHEPENTVLSVEKAIGLGADWVEVDVYVVDGRLIVFHDDRLERTTDGKGYVFEKTFDYLRTLNAGKGQKIPTLEEVFAAVDRRSGLNIELKGPHTAEPVVCLIRDQIEKGWRYEKILVSSFNHHQLLHVKNLDSKIRTGALIAGQPFERVSFAQKLGCFSVHISIDCVDRAFVDDAHARGLRVFVFTVNETQDAAHMAYLGVDGVFTDYPERVAGPKLNAKQPGRF